MGKHYVRPPLRRGGCHAKHDWGSFLLPPDRRWRSSPLYEEGGFPRRRGRADRIVRPYIPNRKTPLTMPSHGQGRKLRGTTLIWPVPRPSLRPITVPFRPAYCSFSWEAPGPEHPSCPPPCTIRRLSLRQVSGRIPLLRHITKSFYADSADLSSLRRRFPKFRSN